MSRIKIVVLGLVMAVCAGCGKSNKDSALQQPPAVQAPAVEPAPTPAPPAPESAPVSTQAEAPKPAPVITQAAAPRPVRAPKPKAEQMTSKPVPTEPPAPPAQPDQPFKPAASIQEPSALPSANAVAPVSKQSEAPAVPKAPEPQIYILENGTVLNVRLQDPLDSGINKPGEKFGAILDQDLIVNGKIVVPRGSFLEGKISQVAQSGRLEGRAALSIQLVHLATANHTYPIQTEILSFEAESTRKKDATKVGIGAGLGAVIGAIAGGGKGAAIGAAVGAGAGGATVAATRGKEVQMPKEHKLSFVLSRDVTLKLQ